MRCRAGSITGVRCHLRVQCVSPRSNVVGTKNRNVVDTAWKNRPKMNIMLRARYEIVIDSNQAAVAIMQLPPAIETSGGVYPDVGVSGCTGQVQLEDIRVEPVINASGYRGAQRKIGRRAKGIPMVVSRLRPGSTRTHYEA